MIKDVVVKATLQFFKDGQILPNYNSIMVVIILKNQEVECIDHYRPITLAGCKHKIITKILADRFAQVFPHIISKD